MDELTKKRVDTLAAELLQIAAEYKTDIMVLAHATIKSEEYVSISCFDEFPEYHSLKEVS